MASASSDLATSLFSLVGLRRPSFSSRSSSLLPLLPSSSPPRSLRASCAVSSSSPRRSFFRFTDPGISASPSTVYGRRKLQGRPFATPTETGEYSDFRTMIPPDDRIPATIITGFLGSGKTTLLNHILTADHGKKIAVIENEYGEVDIDGALVTTKTVGADDIIMLNNGCLCCTVRSDLVRMIAELVDKRKGKFDHIVIETTGLANPAPIIQTFYLEDKIFKNVKLDGVVTLVDAKNVNFHLDDIKPKGVVNEAVEQIAYADRILVNKIDLVGEHEIASLVQRIKKMNGLADLKETKFGQVNLEYVLGIGGFDLERIENDVKAEILTEFHDDGHGCNDHNHDHGHHTADENHVHGHGHNHVHGHGHDHVHGHGHDHVHDPGVSSVSIVCEGSLDPDKADMFMGMLLLERSQDMYRMKGILSINGMNERFVFQGVHDIFQGSPDRPWHPDERRVNKIVFIGKNLDSGELEKGFKACLV